MNILKGPLLLFSLLTLLSCSSLWRTASDKVSYGDFKSLKVGVDNLEQIKSSLGSPGEAYYLGSEKQIVSKSDSKQWIYGDKGLNKLYLSFEEGVLVSKSWNVDEKEKMSSVWQVLREYEANWTVVKEPMSNPHSGPTDCYLEDLKNGKIVKVNGLKKIVSEISVWVPSKNEKSIKEHLNKNVGKEFCIAKHCSKVTTPDAWDYNHCEWLDKIVAKKVEGVRKKKNNSKKPNNFK